MTTRFRRRLALAGATAAAVAAVAGPAAGDAQAARGMELSLQDDSVFVNGKPIKQARGLDFARKLGATRIKINAAWEFMAPAPNSRTKPASVTYDFGPINRAIDAAARKGIRVHLTFGGRAPAWATSNKRRGPVRPSVSAFKEFVRQGMVQVRNRVDRYSIWNEPNWYGWIAPAREAPRIYAKLYDAGYKEIKKAQPRAQVLFGELAPTGQRGRSTAPLKFLRQVFCTNRSYRPTRRCAKLRADGFAMHPYDLLQAPNRVRRNKDDVTMANLGALTKAVDTLQRRRVLLKNGGGRHPLHLTEFGYLSSGSRARKQRTRWLPLAFNMAYKNRRVKSMLQYLLVSPRRGSSTAFFDTGLLSYRGTRAQPTYRALQKWSKTALRRRWIKRPGGRVALPAAPF